MIDSLWPKEHDSTLAQRLKKLKHLTSMRKLDFSLLATKENVSCENVQFIFKATLADNKNNRFSRLFELVYESSHRGGEEISIQVWLRTRHSCSTWQPRSATELISWPCIQVCVKTVKTVVTFKWKVLVEGKTSHWQAYGLSSHLCCISATVNQALCQHKGLYTQVEKLFPKIILCSHSILYCCLL